MRKYIRIVMFLVFMAYTLAFFPIMLFGRGVFHEYKWDEGQTSLLVMLWMMSMVLAYLYYPNTLESSEDVPDVR